MSRTAWLSTGAALALLAVAGCTSVDRAGGDTAGEDALREFYQQEVTWQECGEGFECATYQVPLDYAEPDGERLDIAVRRLPAAAEDAVGSLVVNPGGPGGSGVDYVGAADQIVSEEVRERFDMVGFDPRGVGRSAPVECLDEDGLDDFFGAEVDTEDGDADMTEVTDSGLEELEELNQEFVEACERNSGELMMHLETANVARDMDVLRGVLGDDGLSYLGKSYGTAIGAHYADQFPDRVRALVLDGAVPPETDPLEMSVQQAGGFETALRAFMADCLGEENCPLGEPGDDVDDGVAELADLLADAARDPLDSTLDDGREVNRARAELGVTAAMYQEDLWPRLRTALADAFDGDGTGLLELGDRLYDRRPDGNYENMSAALISVNCSDYASPRDIESYEEASAEAAEESPLFGASFAWGALPCAYWPEEAVAEPAELTGEGADPVLVVGTTRDSATPYEWSEELAARLDSGVLLTRDGDGHTGYQRGNECVDAAVDAYLLETEVVEDGTVC
ncbi:pimeloyl-ACP methyl ester carboxylesterase [Lipingzhangella halophila]|uniref:Pimeloyl-ACP methyl ester carboxylesterase n=1 Tax=Lipingzhangella halophila TaxID=1783352 RepID=A0A7W7W503_9ACTN|nr:alpha/beta hydrolase [Lipingzhangella halophila]MBB4934722.1 pimeloyl-ACP methyl ester carboxylesterase [Lipingzhangella halophila]